MPVHYSQRICWKFTWFCRVNIPASSGRNNNVSIYVYVNINSYFQNLILHFNLLTTHGCELTPLYSEEIGKSKFNSMIGLVDCQRIDEKLYDDFETAKAREVCMLVLFIFVHMCPFIKIHWNDNGAWFLVDGHASLVTAWFDVLWWLNFASFEDQITNRHNFFLKFLSNWSFASLSSPCRNDWPRKLVIKKFKWRMLHLGREWRTLQLRRQLRVVVKLQFSEWFVRYDYTILDCDSIDFLCIDILIYLIY